FANAHADRLLGLVDIDIQRRDTAEVLSMPTNSTQHDSAVHRQRRILLSSFIAKILSGRGVLRRGKKRLPPHRFASASPSRRLAAAGRQRDPSPAPRFR